MPEKNVNYTGIDVSKRWLDCAFTDTECVRLTNDAAGFRRIIARVRALGSRVVMEATGAYHQALVGALWAAGIEACVVPPGRVRAFAKALGWRAKTDRIDAQLLRRYGEQCHPRLWKPPPRERTQLRVWVDARRALIEQRVDWSNRVPVVGDGPMRRIRREQLALIARQLDRIDDQVKAHLDQQSHLRQQAERWQQILGVGPITAWTLLAYLPEIEEPDVSENELAALTGLAPDANESGERKRPRHIAGGRWQVRCMLHMAARTARRHNPILREFGDRLEKRGKPYKVVITAVSRKLLLVLRKLTLDPDFSLA